MDEEKNEAPPEAQQTKEKAPAPQPVTVVGARGESALVEWQDGEGLHRAYIPLKQVKDGAVSMTVLRKGIPYGVPWENVELAPVTGQQLAINLRQAGIWTREDLSRQQRRALGVLQALYQVDLASLNRLAAKEA
jgi:hypothetical protein